MADWVSFSEFVRNAALAVAAIVGAILAWRQLSPASLQARSANAQADLARRAHVTELFNRAVGQLRDPNLWKFVLLQFMFCARWGRIFQTCRTLSLSCFRLTYES